MIRGTGICNSAILAVAALCHVASAERITLHLSRRGPTTANAEVELRLERLDVHTDTVVSRVSFRPQERSAETVLEAPPGSSWQAYTRSGNYWIAPKALTVGPDARIDPLDLWPAGTVSGSVRLEEKAVPPSEVTARFRRLQQDEPLEGTLRCPVTAGSFQCQAPTGTLDLRLRVGGHVTEYFWGKTVRATERLELGVVSFRLGASVVGFVSSSERGAPDPAKTRIVLRSSPGKGPVPTGVRASLMTERSVPVDGRGFFHVDDVAPGLYDLTALQAGFAEAKATVEVLEGTEASLREPLLLERPRELRVTVVPDRDPEGRQWTLELFSVRDGTREPLGEFPVATDGRWSLRGLSAGGRYLLRVKTATGMRWWGDDEEFRLAESPTERRIELDIERVEGNVRIGSAPLSAHLKFGGRSFVESVETLSRSDGTFQVALPRLGAWDVNVSAADPPVARLVSVDIVPGSDGRARAEITLGDEALNGEIVDEAGQRIAAMITVRRSGAPELFQKRTEDGLFRFAGLVPGTYVVYGANATLNSDGQEARVLKGEETPPLRIVAKRPKQIRGRLVGPDGRPVTGAVVLPLEAPGVPTGMERNVRTDLEGRFVLPVSPALDERCVLIAPPGMAADTHHMRVQDDEQLVQADQHFGALSVDYPQPHYDDFAMLFRNGCMVLPHVMASSMPGAMGDDGGNRRTYRFPTVESGPWTLCMVDRPSLAGYRSGKPAFGRCSEAVVPGGSDASITVVR